MSKIIDQVAAELAASSIPQGLHERVEQAARNRAENGEALKRMEEIKGIVKRIDFRWEKGFMTPEEHIRRRSQLQKEMEALRPIDYDKLIEATDLIENFATYWDKSGKLDNPEETRQQLIAKIVNKVFVYDDQVIVIALYGGYGVILDSAILASNEIMEGTATETKMGTNSLNSACARSGSDGS